MINSLQLWLKETVEMMAFEQETSHLIYLGLLTSALLLGACGVGLGCRRIVVPIATKLVKKTYFMWDDYLFNKSILISFCHLITPVIFYVLLLLTKTSFVAGDHLSLFVTLQRISEVFIVVAGVRLVCKFLDNAHFLTSSDEKWQKHTVAGLFQFAKLTVVLIGIIVATSLLFGHSPLSLIAGLGAAATVVMFIFKDTLLGLVSGIQLSANGMLHIGDWITISKLGIDGVVEQVSLVTVKVRNWDNTISTVPPYTLVNDSFQNWRGMKESTGRRVRRTLYIDVNSIDYCSKELIDKVKEKGLFPDGCEITEHTSNMTLLRLSIENYLLKNENVNSDAMCMVRQIQGSSLGVPLELYFFLYEKEFVAYERKQSLVVEDVMTMIPFFELKLFQPTSGRDVKELKG